MTRMTASINAIYAAGGGGGKGLLAQASTFGGAVYLTAFFLHTTHVLTTWATKGRKAARRLAEDILDEEYKL